MLRPAVRRALRRAFVPLAVLTAIACPATVLASAWMAARAAPHTYRDPASVPRHTAAIVLGARVYPDGAPSPVLEDRLEAARILYITGRVERILVSGDHGRTSYDEVTAMQRWLLAHGVPGERVFLDHAGFRTLDTMARAASVFRVRDAVVCTQAFHLPRALFLAQSAGINADGLIADRRVYQSRRVDAAREMLARSKALLDRYVFATRPHFGGPAVPIDGPSNGEPR